MDIKTVIFDLDGTLLDSIEDVADANNKMLSSYGYPEHSVDKYITWIGNGARKLVVASLPPDISLSEERIWDYVYDYTQLYKVNIDKKTRLYDGIDRVLDYLRKNNIPVSINTNKPQELTDVVCKKYFTRWSFEFIYGSNGNFQKKPNPQAALAIAKSLGIDAGNALFVGDSAVDLKTARRAGMPSLGVRWGYGNKEMMKETGATEFIDSPMQIIEFIDKNKTD